MAEKPRFYAGTSGYQYKDWKGIFYPADLPVRDWFRYYATRFDTVEINNTFYRLPPADVWKSWYENAPRGFCYAVKFSRYGSHLKRLLDPEQSIHNYIERAELLGRHLGPILVQLPPRWNAQPDRLSAFLRRAPGRHRWAVEFRDESWLCEPIYAILREHNAALCIHDMIKDHPRQITADWVYLRFHGQHYAGSYPAEVLKAEAIRIRQYLRQGLDVYAYFNNDIGGHAVFNAIDLRGYVEAARSDR
jgi:uncharacterized protein YecE (DUF72 family)